MEKRKRRSPDPDTASPDRGVRIRSLQPWLDRARSLHGWDFGDIHSRNLGPSLPWYFSACVLQRVAGRHSVLDMGTGGGELLAILLPAFYGRVVATEEWSRNAPVAFRRLTPLGVSVVRSRSLHLPFADATFDLVIDRHEEFDPPEVGRVLAPGGEFITQQVGHQEWRELRRFLPRMNDFGDLRLMYSRGFERLGFEVEGTEHSYTVTYPSLGEIVFMLGVSPWTLPDFDLVRDLDALVAFEAQCSDAEGVVVTESRFLITARKPG